LISLRRRVPPGRALAAAVLLWLLTICVTGVDVARARVVWSHRSPMVGGESGYDRGQFVYQDWLYDDEGAREPVPGSAPNDSKQFGGLSRPSGMFRYPADAGRYGANAADLDRVRFALQGRKLWIRAELNTLLVPDSTVVGLAFGTATSPLHAWPLQAGISTPSDVGVTLWGTGGQLDEFQNGRLRSLSGVSVSVRANAIEASVPLSQLPATRRLRVYAATGLWDSQAHSWMAVAAGLRSAGAPGGGAPGAPRLWNVAFRRGEEPDWPWHTDNWFEDKQADDLAAGNITADYATLDLKRMAAGYTYEPPIPRGRLVEAIYRSSVAVGPGEGVSEDGIPGRGPSDYQGDRYDNFLGHEQPYALYVPQQLADPAPALVILHGGTANHTSVVNEPGAEAQLADADRRILVSPLGRGPNSQYTDEAELDPLEALDDAERRLPIDHDRVSLAGYSMGGFGAYRIAGRYADRFSSLTLWDANSGTPGEANGDPHELLDNLRDLPVQIFHNLEDELEPYPTKALSVSQRLSALGYTYELVTHPIGEHITFAAADNDWTPAASWMEAHAREAHPRHVTFKRAVGWDAPPISSKLTRDSLYWVKHLEPRNAGTDPSSRLASFAVADATAMFVPGPDDPGTPFQSTGVDALGPYVASGDIAPTRDGPLQPELKVKLTNVATVTLDTTSLDAPQRITLVVTTDGPTVVRVLMGSARRRSTETLRLSQNGTYSATVSQAMTPRVD
jgi:pimeloyl-ACP methyl ester carboxylesterase